MHAASFQRHPQPSTVRGHYAALHARAPILQRGVRKAVYTHANVWRNHKQRLAQYIERTSNAFTDTNHLAVWGCGYEQAYHDARSDLPWSFRCFDCTVSFARFSSVLVRFSIRIPVRMLYSIIPSKSSIRTVHTHASSATIPRLLHCSFPIPRFNDGVPRLFHLPDIGFARLR